MEETIEVANEEVNKTGETDPKKQIACGIDEEGFLHVKIHVSFGLWNLLGVCEHAKLKATAFFNHQAMAQETKGLVRPNGQHRGFFNKWGKR
jgi:hypothetical protein